MVRLSGQYLAAQLLGLFELPVEALALGVIQEPIEIQPAHPV
jgi:hypothetical protein